VLLGHSPSICCTLGAHGKCGGRDGKEAICRPPPWYTLPTATSSPSPEGKKVMSTESGELSGSWEARGGPRLWSKLKSCFLSLCFCGCCGAWKGAV